jgi:hypothetical protein
MIYHLPIIKHFVKVNMSIIHHISWVNSLNNELFYRIDRIEQNLKMDYSLKQPKLPDGITNHIANDEIPNFY